MPSDEGAVYRAKIFWNGRSQAVRLPKQCRFDVDEVWVRTEGERVVLEPIELEAWPEEYFEEMPVLDDDWTRPVDSPPEPVERERDLPGIAAHAELPEEPTT